MTPLGGKLHPSDYSIDTVEIAFDFELSSQNAVEILLGCVPSTVPMCKTPGTIYKRM